MYKLRNKRNNGITLIALVITIIVILILAAISITMLTGDNGILNKAVLAKDATRGGEVQETVSLAATHNTGVDYTGGTKQKREEVIAQLHTEGKLTDSEVATLEENDTIVIGGITIDFSVLGGNGWEYNHATQTVKKGSLELKIGDYVQDKDYLETDGTTIKKDSKGFDGKWRVLGVEDGQLLLVTDTYYAPFAEDTTNGIARSSSGSVGPDLYGLQLSGKDGYDNGVARLNKIGEQYNNSKLEKGRSINPEDINKITGYNPNNTGVNDPGQTGTGTPFGNGNAWQYKNKVTYSLEGGKVWYQGTNAVTTKTQSTYHTSFKLLGETNNISSPYPIESTAYAYYPTTLTETQNDTKSVGLAKESVAYNMLFTVPYAPYWLASPLVYAGEGYASWRLFFVSPPGDVYYVDLWSSSNGSNGGAFGVRPAISLKSNITPSLVTEGNATTPAVYEI